MVTKTRTRKTLASIREKKSTPDDLSTRAMLVKLKLSRWGAKTKDEDVAEEIANAKHMEQDQGEYTKILLKSKNLAAYRQAQRACRRHHRLLTLPWDDGVGLLPADMYFKYTEEIGEIRREAQQHIDAFVEEYREQWLTGMKEWRKGLGDLFKAEDYPEPDAVAAKFGISIRTYPITNPNDFRVKMSGDVVEKLRDQMEADFKGDLTEAIKVPIRRLYNMVAKVERTLKDEDKIFRDSLIENVRELTEILPSLNIVSDPDIADLIKQTQKDIGSISDVKALRKDPEYRKDVAKSASKILKQMKGYV